MKISMLKQILHDQEAKTPVALVTQLETGRQALVYYESATGSLADRAEILTAARRAMQDDKTGTVTLDIGEFYFQIFNPPLRMLIVGAVHIAQPLSRMASNVGYDVTVVDPRQSFGSPDRFPGISLNHEWPDDGLRKLDIDRRTAVVTLTHDPKLDDPALGVAIRSEAFYIGSLGSRGTHAGRVERLKNEGFTETEITRINGPIGIKIGAISPAEIAISILGEVTECLHAKDKKAVA
jgi:xanthine dehydrogenase accessory factor